MFRKIHSRSGASLGASLAEAFGSRLHAFGFRFRLFCQRHPKKLYSLMVLLMCSSLVLCFSIMRLEKPDHSKRISPVAAASGASGNISLNIDKLQRVMALQAELEQLSKKQRLSSADSARFIAMLTEIKQLTNSKK